MLPEDLHAGYCTEDEYWWICEACFHDFQDMFQWKVVGCQWADVMQELESLPGEAREARCHRKISYERLLQIQRQSPADCDGLVMFGSRLLRGEAADCSLERFVRENVANESLMEELLGLWGADFGERKREFLRLILQLGENGRVRARAERQMRAVRLSETVDPQTLLEAADSAEPLDLLALARNPHAPAAVLQKLVQTKGVKYAKEIRTSAGKNLERNENRT